MLPLIIDITLFFQARFLLSKVNPSLTHNNPYTTVSFFSNSLMWIADFVLFFVYHHLFLCLFFGFILLSWILFPLLLGDLPSRNYILLPFQKWKCWNSCFWLPVQTVETKNCHLRVSGGWCSSFYWWRVVASFHGASEEAGRVFFDIEVRMRSAVFCDVYLMFWFKL